MQPEFSRIIDTDSLNGKDKTENIKASSAECKALAKRFKISAIGNFSAHIVLNKTDSGEIKIIGELTANVTLTSIVSLNEFETEIKDKFKVTYSPSYKEEDGNLDLSSEDFEPLISPEIDIGELASEYLALAIPPFPKKQGEKFSYTQVKPNDKPDEESPFAVLKSLK